MYKLESPEERRPVPKVAVIMTLLLVVGIIALVIIMGLQQPDSSTQDGAIEFVIATEELTSGEEIIISVSNATLYVPRDAINLAVTISISPRPPNLFSLAEQSEWSRTLVVNVEYRNEEGTPYPLVTLSKPFLICFKVTNERWQDYLSHQDEYQVHYYAEELEPPGWQPIPMLTHPERNELCGQTDHFSLFALAVKKPDSAIPVTSATPTPKPRTLFDLLSDIFSPDRPDGVYEP
jgi:hypothetical protein